MKLQAVDSTLHTLQHQRENIAEQAQLVALAATREPIENKVRDARIVVEDLQIDLQKAESDVEAVKVRHKRDSERADSGAVNSPKDLARLQTELTSLARRIDTLEGEELDVMERLEAAQGDLAAVEQELAAIDTTARALMAARDARKAEIDAEIVQLGPVREEESVGITPDLLALYDKLRVSKGGVGAAELRARQCGGCMLAVDTAELATIKAKPVDEVVRCEECQRILVRTPESGL